MTLDSAVAEVDPLKAVVGVVHFIERRLAPV